MNLFNICPEDGETMGYLLSDSTSREQRLWIAVIAQAIEDALLEPHGIINKGHKAKAIITKKRACDFFYYGQDSFRSEFETICNHAGITDHIQAQKKILDYLTNPNTTGKPKAIETELEIKQRKARYNTRRKLTRKQQKKAA